MEPIGGIGLYTDFRYPVSPYPANALRIRSAYHCRVIEDDWRDMRV